MDCPILDTRTEEFKCGCKIIHRLIEVEPGKNTVIGEVQMCSADLEKHMKELEESYKGEL